MILYIFVDRAGDELSKKMVFQVREGVIAFTLCKSIPASHLSTRKSLPWDCRTAGCYYPSLRTICEESSMPTSVTPIKHWFIMLLVIFLKQWSFTWFLWPRLYLEHMWMDHDRFQSKLNFRVRLEVKDSLLTLLWSERICDTGWIIPLPSCNAGLLQSFPYILLSPDICVTTKFILPKQLLLNTILNILLCLQRDWIH
jgi:hypothetical protein